MCWTCAISSKTKEILPYLLILGEFAKLSLTIWGHIIGTKGPATTHQGILTSFQTTLNQEASVQCREMP